MDLPDEFTANMAGMLGEEFEPFLASLSLPSPVSVRLNPDKTYPLDGMYEKVPWCETGYYIPERLPFTFDPLFHAGAYYVQEASSMFVGHILRQLVKEPVMLLDLCAAPGGKTTLALSSLPEGSFVVSNEYVPQRAAVLAENVIKWGTPFCAVTNASPSDCARIKECFDVIIADVPCSGEGMFRKDPLTIAEWSPGSVKACVRRQRSIIDDVWPALRPGGLLIYSTCTYNTAENEDMAAYLCRGLGCEPARLAIPPEWNVMRELKGDVPVYRFMPHRTAGEGFSVTVVRKPGHAQPFMQKRVRSDVKGGVKIPGGVKDLLETPEDYRYGTLPCGSIYALPKNVSLPAQFPGNIKVLHAGITVAEPKGRDMVPHQSLLASRRYRRGAFPDIPLETDEALAYLRREVLMKTATSRGYATVSYKGVPIGWVKQVGTRSNNLYPQEWRIRSSRIPAENNVLPVKIRGI